MPPTLKGRIALDTASVTAAMRTVNRQMAAFSRNWGRPLAAAGARIARIGAVVAGAGAAGTAYALKQAGAFDMLQLRLESAMGSAEKANRAFAETFRLFVRSPMELEPLVQARVLLESFGVTGPKALESVANAAAVMGRDVADIASAVGSMETEPLRRLGVQLRKNGEDFTMAFRDKGGRQVQLLANGIDDARQKLLQAFDVKFSGGLEKMAKTWPGAMSTFTGATKAAFGEVGRGIQGYLLPSFYKVNDAIVAALESGRLREFGERIGRMVGRGIQYLNVLLDAWKGLTAGQRTAMLDALKIGGAFVLAWKTGLLAPIVSGLVRLIATSKVAFGAVTGAAVLAGGYALGNKLEKSLRLPDLLLAAKELATGLVGLFTAAVKGIAARFAALPELITALVRGNRLGAEMIWARLDAESAGRMEEVLDNYVKGIEAIKNTPVPESSKLSLLDLVSETEIAQAVTNIIAGVTSGIAALPLPTAINPLEGVEEDAERTESALERIRRLTAPLRGWGITGKGLGVVTNTALGIMRNREGGGMGGVEKRIDETNRLIRRQLANGDVSYA